MRVTSIHMNYCCRCSFRLARTERIHSRRGMKITQNCSRFLLLVIILGFAMWAVLLPPAAQAKKLNVVTSTTDMAALTQEVGGDKISVESIAKGYRSEEHTSELQS